MKYSKIIVILCIALAVVFTVAVLILMSNGMAEPITLIPSFFAFITGELWALSNIKKKEVQNGTDTDNHRDAGAPDRSADSSCEADLE